MIEKVLYIARKDDEHLYQPAIHSERIRQLYELVVLTGQPMTVLVDLAIQDYYQTLLDQASWRGDPIEGEG